MEIKRYGWTPVIVHVWFPSPNSGLVIYTCFIRIYIMINHHKCHCQIRIQCSK